MESDHDDIPVAIAKMPSNPRRRVSSESHWQNNHISNDYDRACQDYNQTNKHQTKPAGNIIHSPKHWFKDRVENHIRVSEGVKVK